MKEKLPNLELLEYKALLCFNNSKVCREKLELARKEQELKGLSSCMNPYFHFDVFLQTWSSTCTAFDISEDGYPVYSGQMMTDAYTTVAHEIITDTYFVFVDNRICYMIEEPNEKFLQDLKDRKLLGLSEAKMRY